MCLRGIIMKRARKAPVTDVGEKKNEDVFSETAAAPGPKRQKQDKHYGADKPRTRSHEVDTGVGEVPSLQEPPEQWQFRKLLCELNSMINTGTELDSLKYRFKGLFKQSVIDEITTPMQLFTKMEQRNILNMNNTIFLQAIIYDLNRPELVKKIIDFCSNSEVLYFKAATEAPANGFKYIKFHLYLDKLYTRRDVEDLQSKVAKILCVPDEFVCIAGVEPSRSLLVTLMLPKMYVGILVEYLDLGLLLDRFAELCIDRISIDDKIYVLKVTEPGGRKSDEQLVSLYHQLSSRDQQLDGMEQAFDRLKQTIETKTKRTSDKTSRQEVTSISAELKRTNKMLKKLFESNAMLLGEHKANIKIA